METIINKHDYKYDIFISYSRHDIRFVTSLVVYLEKYGYSICRNDDHLYVSEEKKYVAQLKDCIDASAVFLYIHSETAHYASYIQEIEIPYALERGKKILIYRYKEMDLEYKHPELNKLKIVIPGKNVETGKIDVFCSIRSAIQCTFGDMMTSGIYTSLVTGVDILSRHQLKARLQDVVFIWPVPESSRQILEGYGFFSEKVEEGDLHKQLRRFLSGCPGVMQVDAFLEETACEVADEFVQNITWRSTIFNGPMLGVLSVSAGRPADSKGICSLELDMYRSDYFTFRMMSRIYQKLLSYDGQNLFDIRTFQDLSRFAPFFCSLGVGGFVVTPDAAGGKALWAEHGTALGTMYNFSYDEIVSVKDVKDGEVDLYGAIYRGTRENFGAGEKYFTGQGGIFELGIIQTDKRMELEMLSYLVLKPSMYAGFKELLRTSEGLDMAYNKYFFLRFNEYRRELAAKMLAPEAFELIRRLEVRNNNQQLFSNFQYSALAQVGEQNKVGQNVLVDDFVIIGNRCRIGDNCKIHYFSHIDDDVVIGNNVKIQNNVMIPHGVTLQDGVFVGPSVVFTNDKHPRSVTPDGKLKTGDDWVMTPTLIKQGASLGGGAVIVCGVTVGRWAMVGAGALVTKDVPDYALVAGCPARIIGKVNEKGEVIERI